MGLKPLNISKHIQKTTLYLYSQRLLTLCLSRLDMLRSSYISTTMNQYLHRQQIAMCYTFSEYFPWMSEEVNLTQLVFGGKRAKNC